MGSKFHAQIESIKLSGVFYALCDPIRLKIVKLLAKDSDAEVLYSELNKEKSLTNIRYHLNVLCNEGIIYMYTKGKYMLIRLRWDEVESKYPGLWAIILNTNQKGL